jgi:hypothetical protein
MLVRCRTGLAVPTSCLEDVLIIAEGRLDGLTAPATSRVAVTVCPLSTAVNRWIGHTTATAVKLVRHGHLVTTVELAIPNLPQGPYIPDWLPHVDITLKIYAHTSLDVMREAARRLNDKLL